MNDDVSAIPSSGCSVMSSSDYISNYNGNVKKDFVFNGGKWYLYRTQTASYGSYDISSFNCINVSDLNSNAVYLPILHFISFFMVVVLGFVLFSIIRKVTRWF